MTIEEEELNDSHGERHDNNKVVSDEPEGLIVEASERQVDQNGTEQQGNDDEPEAAKSVSVFPTPGVWYNPNGADGRDGMFTYLNFNRLIIAEVSSDTNASKWPQFMTIVQKERFSSVALEQGDWDGLTLKDSPVATGDHGGCVKIWNVKTRSCVMHDGHYNKKTDSANVVVDIKWSTKNLVYSIDPKGLLCIWNPRVEDISKAVKSFHLIKSSWEMSCLAVLDEPTEIIAVGEKGGGIHVMSMSEGVPQPLIRMFHEPELIGLRWVPDEDWSGINSFNEKELTPPFLISTLNTSKLPNFRIWDLAGRTTLCKLIDEEVEMQRPQRRFEEKTFIPMQWVTVNRRKELAIGFRGQIGLWETARLSVLHEVHRDRNVFNIVQTGDVIWTIGREAMIVGWHLPSSEVHCVIPTAPGITYAQESPSVPEVVAAAGTDGVVRFIKWNEGYPVRNNGVSPTLTIRPSTSACKITALAWHPTKDLIAFGTDLGMVGTYDCGTENRLTNVFEKRVSGVVYAVDWGPVVYKAGTERQDKEATEEPKNDMVLYICADFGISWIRPGNRSRDFRNIYGIIKAESKDEKGFGSSKVTEMKWDPTKRYLCVGYFDGRVDILEAPHLQLRCRLRCHNRAKIQLLSWRPTDFLNDPDSESLSRWLACASDDGRVTVHNLARLFDSEALSQPIIIQSPAVTLDGHNSVRVVSLAWSRANPRQMVTVSYDWSAVVWDAIEGRPLARFPGTQRLVACFFHPSEPGKVVTCGDELYSDGHYGMKVWDIQDYPYTKANDAKKEKVKSKVLALKAEREEKEHEENDPITVEVVSNADITICHVPSSNYVIGDETRESSQSAQEPPMQKTSLIEAFTPLARVKAENVLPVIAELERLCDNEKPEEGHRNEVAAIAQELFQYFMSDKESPKAAAAIVLSAIDFYVSRNEWNQAACLARWAGQVEYVIQKAIERKADTRAVMNLAIWGGPVFKYPEQLVELRVKGRRAAGDFHTAAELMLELQKPAEAIEVYVAGKLYDDAYALLCGSMVRLMKKKVRDRFVPAWIDNLVSKDQFPQAIVILYCIKNINQLYEYCEAWGNPVGWRIGLLVAEKEKNEGKSLMFSELILYDLMLRNEHAEAVKFVHDFEDLKFANLVVKAHQWLVAYLGDSKPENSLGDVLKSLEEPEDLKVKLPKLMGFVHAQTKSEALIVIAKNLVSFWAAVDKEKAAKEARRMIQEFFGAELEISSLLPEE